MTITKYAPLLLMMLVGFTGLLNAQTVKTQVPFAFVANGKTMPAGECTIAVVGTGRTLLSISSGERHVFALPAIDVSPNASKKTALVFHRYGTRYFLVAVQHEGGTGYQLPASRPERELQAGNIPWQAFTLLASAK